MNISKQIIRIITVSLLTATLAGCGSGNSNRNSAAADFYRQNNEEGLEKVEKQLADDPINTENTALHAGFKVNQGDYLAAISELSMILQEDPDNAFAHAILAIYYSRSQNNLVQAESESKIALQLDPELPVASMALGEVYLIKGNYDESLQLFQTALQYEPDYVDALLYICQYRILIQNYDAALTVINQAIKINDKLPTLYTYRGITYFYMEEYTKAEKDFSKAIKLGTPEIEAYLYRGSIYDKNSEFDKAIADMLEVIKMDPNNAIAYNILAYDMALIDQDINTALSYVEKSLQLSPSDAAIFDTKAFVYYKLGRYDEAMKIFNNLISNGHDSSYFGRGMVYAALEETDKAKSDLETYLAAYPDSYQSKLAEQTLDGLK